MILIETINQFNFTRGYTYGRLKQSSDTEWDTQPKGYNNTIRWNVGHIFVFMETFTHLAIPKYEAVHPEWIPLFTTGSSPASWKGKIPSNEELRTALEEQSTRLERVFKGGLDSTIPEPITIRPHKMETVEAVLQFIIWHEGIHAGMIDGLNRATAK